MSVDTREHRVSVVILTRNRRDEVLASIAGTKEIVADRILALIEERLIAPQRG